MLEHDMAVNAENLKSIVEQGNKLARAGHFDSAGILKAVQNFDRRSVQPTLLVALLISIPYQLNCYLRQR